jgi:hypothetical protein
VPGTDSSGAVPQLVAGEAGRLAEAQPAFDATLAVGGAVVVADAVRPGFAPVHALVEGVPVVVTVGGDGRR